MTNDLLTTEKKRVAIYLRVSSEEQADSGYGLDVQRDILEKFCQRNGYSLEERHIYTDAGFSGALPINKRPALQQLFEDAKDRQFDIVLVYRLDRFFRSLKYLLEAVEQLKEFKIPFRSATESFENETINGQLMFHIIASFAQHERSLISERMSNGRSRAAKEGRWVTGIAPYGYRVDKKTHTLVVNEKEAEVVKILFSWLVEERMALTEICRKANELKLPFPERKKKKSNFWWKRTINRILVNEVYTGTFYYRKYKRPFKFLESVLDGQNLRPEDDWISIQVPAIISTELFQDAIRQLRANQERSKRNTKRQYMYAHLLYCGYTNHKLQSGYQTPRVYKDSPILGKYYHTYVPIQN